MTKSHKHLFTGIAVATVAVVGGLFWKFQEDKKKGLDDTDLKADSNRAKAWFSSKTDGSGGGAETAEHIKQEVASATGGKPVPAP